MFNGPDGHLQILVVDGSPEGQLKYESGPDGPDLLNTRIPGPLSPCIYTWHFYLFNVGSLARLSRLGLPKLILQTVRIIVELIILIWGITKAWEYFEKNLELLEPPKLSEANWGQSGHSENCENQTPFPLILLDTLPDEDEGFETVLGDDGDENLNLVSEPDGVSYQVLMKQGWTTN